MGLTHRRYVSYIDKSREYYAAHGYERPYQWVAGDDVAFTPLTKPLSECRVGIVTTSAIDRGNIDTPYTAPSSPVPAAMVTRHLSWHKTATNTDDVGSFLPLKRLHELAAEGTIGEVAPRFFGTPTIYSARITEGNAEQIGAWCQEDQLDLVLLAGL